MYKNFSLTDQERKEIMEQHQSHGYKKPLSEQQEQKGTDEEYKLMGYIVTFMGMGGPEGSTDDRVDWIENYRTPIGRFGKTLFDYLHGVVTSYDENYFNKLMNVFTTPGVLKNTPSDEELINIGKTLNSFDYNN